MIRRTVLDLVVQYKLEPTIRDVYVEGPYDRNIVSWFLRRRCRSFAQVIPVDFIDVPESILAKHGLSSGNKQRLIALAIELQGELGRVPRVTCIVDTDTDRLLGRIIESAYLCYTDFTSMEMYFFDEAHLSKFVELIVGVGQTDIAKLLRDYGAVLQDLFLYRAAAQELGLPLRWLDFTRCCSRDERGLTLDIEEFLSRLLNASGLNGERARLVEAAQNLRDRLERDLRHSAHGHDFIELLSWDFSRAAKKHGLPNVQAVITALVGCLELEAMSEHALFRELGVRHCPAQTTI